MPSSSTFVVFFSWQSEIFKSANRRAVETALRAAASRLEAKYADRELAVHIDKDTTGRSGSPAIADTILQKIEASDMFIGDVTITNAAYAPPDRLSPNANVLLEQGYAIAHLGWDRIVSLFNAACGHPPNALPFDIRHRRISQYTLSEEDSNIAKNKPNVFLTELLIAALTAVIDQNPARPTQLELTDEEIKARRDIESLTRLLNYVNWYVLEEYIQSGPKIRTAMNVDLFEGFQSVLTSSVFHLYDTDLRTKAEDLLDAWTESLSHTEHYEPAKGGNRYIFTGPVNRMMSAKEQQDWDAISAGIVRLRPAMDDFLGAIRERYTSIDIAALSEGARKLYLQTQNELEESFASRVTLATLTDD